MVKVSTFNPELEKKVFLWGDSHAHAIPIEPATMLHMSDLRMTKIAKNACPPAPGVMHPNGGYKCEEHNSFVMRELLEDKDLEVVIPSARWSLSLEGRRFDNEEEGREHRHNIQHVSSAKLVGDELLNKDLIK